MSLCTLYGHDNPFPNGLDKVRNLHDPFVVAQLPNEEIAHKICKRSMLTKAIYDVLVEGASKEELADRLKSKETMDAVAASLHGFLSKSHRVRSVYFGKKSLFCRCSVSSQL